MATNEEDESEWGSSTNRSGITESTNPESSSEIDTNDGENDKQEIKKTPRLNSKLTRRSRAAPPPVYKSNITGEDVYSLEDQDNVLHGLHVTNPRLDMLHSGVWSNKEFKLGRHVPRTGCWSCCGEQDHLSMYCESKLVRKIWSEGIAKEQHEEEVRKRYKEIQTKRFIDPIKKGELGVKEHEQHEDYITSAIRDADESESRFNAPMLVSWVYKHMDQELTITQGLEHFRKQLETGEGCEVMFKNNVVKCVMAAADQWRERSDLVLMCANIIRKLLDCNFTRPSMIEDITLLRQCFQFGHVFMDSVAHVEESCQCVMQFSRNEAARQDIMARKLPVYMTNMCKRYSRAPGVIRPVLKCFNWVATTKARMRTLCSWGAVLTTVKCMQRHNSNGRILAPGMLFLTRAHSTYEGAEEIILKNGGVKVVIDAIKALYANEELQIEGLRMLQMLSRTEEGWKQIDSTRGGWQSICQGTTQGNALIHDLPGTLNNPGWAIGDTPHLPAIERIKQDQMKKKAARARQAEAAEWTVDTLKAFMGLSTKELTLAINNEIHATYFSLLTTLGLLPHPGEEREYWFMRLKAWEKENNSDLDEMTDTLLKLQKKRNHSEEEVEDPNAEYIKPVYFLGEKYNSKKLEEEDIDIMSEVNKVVHKNESIGEERQEEGNEAQQEGDEENRYGNDEGSVTSSLVD